MRFDDPERQATLWFVLIVVGVLGTGAIILWLLYGVRV